MGSSPSPPSGPPLAMTPETAYYGHMNETDHTGVLWVFSAVLPLTLES